MRTLIVVPARYGSTRFAGKPLALINGVSMVRRTARIAADAAALLNDCSYVVATDHDGIKAHCGQYNIPAIMTPSTLPTGSDRALFAAEITERAQVNDIDFIINLQGDAPFTPATYVVDIVQALRSGADVATPYVRLSWEALDTLRRDKLVTPFSGTTVLVGTDKNALWFSKNIIPAIRKEAVLRDAPALSPVCRHIGLYGYRKDVLAKFVTWPESHFEQLEGLEQLRLLENNITIQCVEVEPPKIATSGIDTAEDLTRAEHLIAQLCDPFFDTEAFVTATFDTESPL